MAVTCSLDSWLFVNSTDPGNQLRWLVDELLDAERVGDKVLKLSLRVPFLNSVSKQVTPVRSLFVSAIKVDHRFGEMNFSNQFLR